ncbi:MAG: hypothetical protein ABMB14_01775 [Myxococcota bacterium]
MIWLALAACGPKAGALPTYDAGLLGLAAAFSAKEVCSCVFVAGGSVDDCRAWTRVDPAVTRFRVDFDRGEVHATALGVTRSTARWVDDAHGCVLEPPPQ